MQPSNLLVVDGLDWRAERRECLSLMVRVPIEIGRLSKEGLSLVMLLLTVYIMYNRRLELDNNVYLNLKLPEELICGKPGCWIRWVTVGKVFSGWWITRLLQNLPVIILLFIVLVSLKVMHIKKGPHEQ